VVVHVTDLEILDRLEASQYNKFLSYWVRDTFPRQAGSVMVRAEVLSVRPKPENNDQELRVKACTRLVTLYYMEPLSSVALHQTSVCQPVPGCAPAGSIDFNKTSHATTLVSFTANV
jgi:hypothetical protein